MLLSVTGFESAKTVQVRIRNITTATTVVDWTATGVTEWADGQGYSTYYYDYAIVAGDKYIVDWKDNSSPIRTASEGMNEKQSGVALEGNIETHVTASLNSYDPPTRTEATADKDAIITQVDANETKIDTLLTESQSHPTLAEIEATTVLAKEATLTAQATKIIFIEKWINNKLVEAPTGTWKLYDDDNVTVLKTWTWDAGTLTRSKSV